MLAWIVLNYLHFNERKSEVMVFGPVAPGMTFPHQFGLFGTALKPTIKSLHFKMDSNFKLEGQIGAVVKTIFFHLRHLAKVIPILSRQHFEVVIHAFIRSYLD